MSPGTEHRTSFLVGVALGGPLLAFATFELVTEAGSKGAIAVGRWLVGANLVHDFALAPAVCVIGWLLVRELPRALRAPAGAAMIASGVLLIVAFPVLRGYGRDQVPGNPTVQPLNYASATLTVLGVVWGVCAVWFAIRMVRSRADTH
jgi:hypothetical protein